jgi:hypothetical protein
MIPFHWISPMIAPAVMWWQESGENQLFSVTLLLGAFI